MAGEMALVGKACIVGGFGNWHATAHQALGPFQPPHGQITMRARSRHQPELAGERIPVEIGQRFQLFRGNLFGTVFPEIGAGARDGPFCLGRYRLPAAGMTPQPVRDPGQQIGKDQSIRSVIEIGKRFREGTGKPAVGQHRGRYERQGGRRLVAGIADQFGGNVHHPVAQAVVRACRAVVNLVGVKNDDVSRQAETCLSPIGEGLHAADRQSERIGIVPMRREAVAGKLCLDALDAVGIDTGTDRVGRPARTFKTFAIGDW